MAKSYSNMSFEAIFESFYFYIQEDKDFFCYYNLDEAQTQQLVQQRAIGFLKEAIARLCSVCTPQVDFYDFDELTGRFNFELNDEEIALLTSLMFEVYLAKGLARFRNFKNALTSQDIKYAFSPYAERNSYMNMYKEIRAQNNKLIDTYISKDRVTGERRFPEYTEYTDNS